VRLKLIGHDLKYEAEQIVFLFFPGHENVFLESIAFVNHQGKQAVRTKIAIDGRVGLHEETADQVCVTKKDFGNLVKRSAFYAAKKLSGLPAPWGILTGIRPAKPVLDMRADGMSGEKVSQILKKQYLVSDEKIGLALEIAAFGQKYNKYAKDKISVYIGIPFCPTRCHYCSFISSAVNKTKNAERSYIEALCGEIEFTAQIIRNLNLEIQCVYIGGGTPTTLSEDLLEKLLLSVQGNFGKVLEYTVEAGRPDNITAGKLKLIKGYGANRISINPQTMNDKTLGIIGRSHTALDFINAFNTARDNGMTNINSDIIAGLPGEDIDTFMDTVDKVLLRDPEGITVHTLYIKRTAWLKNADVSYGTPGDISDMLSYAYNRLRENNYIPYYMYKQKSTLGNLENIGYAKKGYECLYNINTMSDKQSIVALGAGAVTKVVLNDRIERIFNYKNADDYINNFETVLERKRKFESFYLGG
jgi:oxygen-independent coproporphyrinogen-3 oxidase